MLRGSAVNRGPRRQCFYRQVRHRDWPLAPQKVFDFRGVLLQHNEVKVVEAQKLANLRRESCSQFFRFAARSDRLADAHNRLGAVAACLSLNDRLRTHSLVFSADARALIYTNATAR